MIVFNTEVEHKISNIGEHLLDTGQHKHEKTKVKFFFYIKMEAVLFLKNLENSYENERDKVLS